MEETAVVMSTGMMMMIGVLLFWFRKGIFNMAELAEETLARAVVSSSDVMETYEKVVKIANVKKREELLNELRDIETRVTSKQLQMLIDGKTEEEAGIKKSA